MKGYRVAAGARATEFMQVNGWATKKGLRST